MYLQKVQEFSLGPPKAGTPRAKQRYRVKWAVDGHHKTRSFKTKAEADRLRSQLQVAVGQGPRFDRTTGYPDDWTRVEATWWTWSCEWLALKWPGWAGKSRKSAVETLVEITPHLVGRRAPTPPHGLRDWLWNEGYVNPLDREARRGAHVAWLERWSLQLDEMTPGVLEPALTATATRQDGQPVAPSVAKRRRDMVKSIFKVAVRRGLLSANPMDRIEWTTPQQRREVDVSTLPSIAEVEELLDDIWDLETPGARFSAFLAMVGYAGLRPSEVAGLQHDDLRVSTADWGLAVLRGATTDPGSRYTADGQSTEAKGLKHRPVGSVREVPLPPALGYRLREHYVRFPRSGQRAFTNAAGRTVTPKNYGNVFDRARTQKWPAGHPLAKTVPYDLRHTAATTMLRAGVSLPEVSRRLGHSVDVLLKVYAGVFHDERTRSNALIDAELASYIVSHQQAK